MSSSRPCQYPRQHSGWRSRADRGCCSWDVLSHVVVQGNPKVVPRLDAHVDWLVAENWVKGSHKKQTIEKVGFTAILPA